MRTRRESSRKAIPRRMCQFCFSTLPCENTAMKTRAFTLIELLIVIAIIGIISAIVLSSLDSARSKGSVASIKADLRNMIPQAALSYDTAVPSSYANACASVAGMLAGVTSVGGTPPPAFLTTTPAGEQPLASITTRPKTTLSILQVW